MSDDGADLNMPVEGAMKAAMGGEQPERLSDAEFEAMIRGATGPNGYDGTGNYAAKLVLEFLETHPDQRDTPIEAVGEFRHEDGTPLAHGELPSTDTPYVKVRDGLYDVMKKAGIPLAELQLTGFMWGWAANAARHILGLDHQPNPAIVTIGGAA